MKKSLFYTSLTSSLLALMLLAQPKTLMATSDEFSSHPYNHHHHLFVVQSSHLYVGQSTASKPVGKKPCNKNQLTSNSRARKQVSWYNWLASSFKSPNLHFLNLLELIGV